MSDTDKLTDPAAQALVEALRDSQQQIEYLHWLIGMETGSGNAVLSRISNAITEWENRNE